ncbi:DUF4407 domain-containing protein [Muricauda ruestringensis]|uniref:DUF4407 domain-containing protein n=1 Tax=Flagellimonas TaxID=444459 RepID=UPI001CD64960|nr:DUF4407 domain-containing protein [Allomuricauda ruestringensis]MCA0958295.1 DUF4407 domain-containing protein [Allomuricauda ruestringensis]
MRPNSTYRFLWKVVGEDEQILDHCGKKIQAVFAISGLLFLSLFLIGILSYRYVFNGIFKIPTISWLLALIWTISIFNIYKLNLSTLSANKPKYSAGYVISLFIRIVFMVLIGITLIKPLEAFIFNKSLSKGLSKVIAEKIENSSKKSDAYFDAEIASVKEELAQLSRQTNEGRISIGNEKFNFLNEKKQVLLDEKDKTLSETRDLFNPSNLFFIGLLVFNKENPWIWFFTLSFLVIFLLPLFLKFSVSPKGKYVRDRIALQKQIILEEYSKFKLLYPEVFGNFSKSQIVWEENYEDSPFNTQRKPNIIKLGKESDFLNQIHGL